MRATVVIGVLCLLGSGCSTPPSSPDSPDPSVLVSPTSVDGSGEMDVSDPIQSPAAPPSPDASTVGALSADSLPASWLGFSGTVVEPTEGEFVPNGTWVHVVDPSIASTEAIPYCKDTSPPLPLGALAGSYRDGQDRFGNGLVLEFASDSEAKKWFAEFSEALQACTAGDAGFTTKNLNLTDTGLTTVRDYPGDPHSEVVWVEERFVRLMIVQGEFPSEQLSALLPG